MRASQGEEDRLTSEKDARFRHIGIMRSSARIPRPGRATRSTDDVLRFRRREECGGFVRAQGVWKLYTRIMNPTQAVTGGKVAAPRAVRQRSQQVQARGATIIFHAMMQHGR